MNKLMQKTAILSLSLMLVSTYAVSCIIPDMLKLFPDHSQASVELLLSVTSFAISLTILLNIWLTRILSERISIIIGAILLVCGGTSTIFFHDYTVILISRILLGFGIGMINARAITIIQTRYDGKEQAVLLGLRGSVEVLGNTLMTFLAGRFMLLGWNMAFGIYFFILPVLFLYLVFVPAQNKLPGSFQEKKAKKSTANVRSAVPFLILVFVLGLEIISTNVAATMRMPSLVLERGFGSASDSSLILTFMLISGVISGTFFERLLRVFRDRILTVGFLSMGIGLLLIGSAGSLWILIIGTVFSGFANGILATILFHNIARIMPPNMLETGTYAALLGCNIGAASTPILLKLIGYIHPGMHISYLFYGFLDVILAILVWVKNPFAR